MGDQHSLTATIKGGAVVVTLVTTNPWLIVAGLVCVTTVAVVAITSTESEQ